VVIGTGSMAPKVVMDPQSQNAAAGDPVSLSVAAVGTAPLSYQWLLNGTNISGATASSLVWTNVQLTDAGTYSVLVSNSVGTTTSSNAVFTVYIPVCTPPPLGLVSWWAAEGDASDAFGTNNGVLQGGAGFARGRVGQAFNLNGSQYVDVSDSSSLNPTTSLSLEAWIYPRLPFNTVSSPVIKKAGEGQGQQDGYALEFTASGAIKFGVYVAGGGEWAITGGVPVPTNQWSHVVGVYDGTNVSIYVNGVRATAPVAAVGSIMPSGNHLQIGHDPSNPPRYFAGLIDEASVYSTALSPVQVLALYGAGNAGKCQTSPPSILTQPESQTAGIGTSVTLSVAATGSRPLSYQWSFNGANLLTATSSTLTLTNAQFSDSGSYAVAVTNGYGGTVSSNAVLTVLALSCAPVPPGLNSWWAAEGNALDWLGINNGVLQNGVGFSPGEVGQAFDLNGTSQYVDVANNASLNPTANISLEAWIYPRSPLNSISAPIIKKAGEGSGQSDGYTLEFSGTSGVLFGVYGGGQWYATAPASVPMNQWSHVAGVYNGTSLSIYVNGALVGIPVSAPGQIAPSGNNLQIGHDPSNPSRFFNGMIDEAGVYNTALSSAQIRAIYNAGSAGKCPLTIPPSILTQPQSQVLAAGATATLSVGAMGASPLVYQWRLYGTNLPAATNVPLTLSNAQPANSGPYDVVITNLYGSITSSVANLTVRLPPQITSQPQDQTAAVGTDVTFAVTATGSNPLIYQWSFNGTRLNAATNSTLVLNGVSLGQGGIYSVLVSNAVGSVSSRGASLIVLGVGACVAPPSGLVGWWMGEGDAFDSFGTNNGTLQNGVGFVSGEVGQAFNLNGTSQYVDVPSSASLNPTTSMSVEAWIYPRLPLDSVAAPIIKKAGEGSGQWDGYTLEFAGTSGVIFSAYVNGGRQWVVTALAPVPMSQWSHVVGVYDGTGASIYINGALVGAPVSGPGQIVPSGNNLQIGHDPSNPSRYFNGLIDEASVYKVALSAAQIQALYAASTAGKCQPAAPPSVQKQPQSQTVAVGASPTFNVLAAGSRPVAYQWRFNGTNTLSASSSALTLTNAQLTDAGNYDVVITNLYGSATSSVATLAVIIPPQITSQPQDQTVILGTSASFTVGVSGNSPFRYQWYFNGALLSSATNSSLVLSPVLLSEAGAYSVTVSNPVGSVSSRSAGLTVLDNGSCVPPPAGMVSWWAAETNALDSAGTNNGILRNGLGFASGRVGQAFNLDGTSEYVDVASSASLNPTASLAVEAWIYPRLPLNSVSAPVIKKAGEGSGQQDGYTLELYPSGAAVFGVYLAGGAGWAITPLTYLPMNQWSHVAGVFDGTNVTFYLNGVPSGVAAAVGQILPSGNNLQLGHDPSNPSRYFNGLIDEASVYKVALSASQVQAIYNSGSAGKCPSSLPPSVLAQPQSQTVTTGVNVSFSALAAGTPPLKYQWQLNGSSLAGATSTLLTLTNVQLTQAGSYAVLVTNLYGSTISSNAVLTVLAVPPMITLQPSSRTNLAGSTATFTLAATGTAPLSYGWQKNGVSLWDAGNVSGAATANLTLSDVQDSDSASYTAIVTNLAGVVTSAPAILSVVDSPMITRQPANQLAISGCTVTFKARATGTTPLIYQWRKDGVALHGQTSTNLVLTNVQFSDFGSYSLLITNAYGWAISSNAVLSLDHPPVAEPDTIQRFVEGGVRVHVTVLLANDTDPDDDGLAIIGVSPNSAEGGAVTLRGNWVLYLPPPGMTNSDTFTYTVSDGHCATAEGTVTVQVKDNNSPAPLAFIENQGDGSFRVTCDGVPGWPYKFQYADDLAHPGWQDIATLTADAWGTCEYIDPPRTNALARFYRAISP
jgi:nitrogen fixation protein